MSENQEIINPNDQEVLDNYFKESNEFRKGLDFVKTGNNTEKLVVLLKQISANHEDKLDTLRKTQETLIQALNGLNARLTHIEKFLQSGPKNQKKTEAGIILPS